MSTTVTTANAQLSGYGLVVHQGSNVVDVAAVGAAGSIPISQSTSADPIFQALSQDLALAATGAATVQGLQTVPVASTAPTSGQALVYGGSSWGPGTPRLAAIAADTVLGNNTGASATPSALTGAQATALLSVFSSTTQGVAPASGGGTANYLRADGSWATPPGTTYTAGAGLSLSGGAFSLNAPTTSVLGGVKALSGATSHNWVSYIDSTGAQNLSQPSFGDLSGIASASQLPVASSSAFGAVKVDGTTITSSSGVISAVHTGTVTSVAFAGDGTIFSSTAGTAVTSSGNVSPSLLSQTANYFLGGPSSGSSANPTFRALTATDITAALKGLTGYSSSATQFLANVSGTLQWITSVSTC